MKLRIARKMDMTPKHVAPNRKRDRRVWWRAYSVDQLLNAERRLRRSWSTHSPVVDGHRNVTPDFFAMNRVHSRRVRQGAINKLNRERKAGGR